MQLLIFWKNLEDIERVRRAHLNELDNILAEDGATKLPGSSTHLSPFDKLIELHTILGRSPHLPTFDKLSNQYLALTGGIPFFGLKQTFHNYFSSNPSGNLSFFFQKLLIFWNLSFF